MMTIAPTQGHSFVKEITKVKEFMQLTPFIRFFYRTFNATINGVNYIYVYISESSESQMMNFQDDGFLP